jgi:hypothetical protein
MASNNGSGGSPKAARPNGSATTKKNPQGNAPKSGAAPKGGASKKGAPSKQGGPKGGAPKGGAPKGGAPKVAAPSSGAAKGSPPKASAPPKSRLAVKVNGAFLDDEAARQMWVEFSAHMDAHENDFEGFARSKGFASAKPEHQEGRAVLVLSR